MIALTNVAKWRMMVATADEWRKSAAERNMAISVHRVTSQPAENATCMKVMCGCRGWDVEMVGRWEMVVGCSVVGGGR